ncbi:hypothetical protein IVA86_20255 [Bradyrhizobium sp. 146]|uniref:hypothetical protein n=1 Tax=Bradyrhizobium sp. 146 TaxID=2782622 RepID=UPI001FF7CBDF|nr:hypothetical protein [Bradyrhizobium sp. 146]MCK1703671.1 hypothetical protein [Bradyrhizobium sp. 146]
MASKRQIEANRANAPRSTGPQTSAGNAASSLNAYRHGLSRWDEPAGSGFDAVLAKDLKGTDMDVAVQDLAQARSRQDRLRALRLILIFAVIEGAEPKQMRYFSILERYEKAALSRQRRGSNMGSGMPDENHELSKTLAV